MTKSVHVTAMWGSKRALDETRWLQSVADKHGFPHGIVCQAEMTDPDLDVKLKEQTQFANLRGVRHQLHWDSHPLRQPNPTPDLCNTPEFRRGFALLEKYGLHFELQVFAGQAKYAVELIKAFPKVPMILLHSGMLTDRAPLMIEQWRAALTAMAAFPNVHVKLSGPRHVQPGHHAAAGAPGDPRLRSRFSASSARFTAAIFRWRNCTPATPISSPSIARSCRNTPRPTSAKCFTTTRSKFYRL